MSTAYDPKAEAVYCGVCATPIEACDGRFSDWMHCRSRREHCYEGSVSLARPETLNERKHRFNLRRHNDSTYLRPLTALSSVG